MAARRKVSAPLVYYGRLIGLFPFRLGDDQRDLQFSVTGLVYGTVLAIAYSIVFVMAVSSRLRLHFPTETPLVIISDGIGITTTFLVPVVVWMTFAYRQEYISGMIRDFSKIQNIAWEYFRIPIDRKTVIRHTTVYGTWINVIYYLRLCILCIFVHQYATHHLPVWVLFSLPHVVHYNTVLLFLLAINEIGRKFRHLNEKLIERGRSVNSSTSINDFAYVHGLLCDLAESVTHFFSHIMLLIVTQHFVQFVTKVYITFTYLKYEEHTRAILATISMYCLDVMASILEEYFIGSIVEATVEEARNTGNALHEMANTQRPLRQRKQVYAFSIQLLRRRLDLSAHGFFKFDLTLMHKVISTATTYVIIMMQLENFNPNS